MNSRMSRTAALSAFFVTGLLLALLVGACSTHTTERTGDVVAEDRGAHPTFYADVLPILEENCQACHRPEGSNLGGMVAPFAFTTYDETRRYAPMIASAVESGRMPPWHAAPEFRGVFENERYLESADVETLVAWAAAGAPAGEPSAAQTASAPAESHAQPQAANGAGGPWTIGEPDLVIRFPEPHYVGDHVHDEYHNILVPLTHEMLPEDRWVKSVEVIPGGTHVHHVIATPVGETAPGVPPRVNAPGHSYLLPEGTTVNIQMHYHKQPGAGTAVYDTTKIGVTFYEPGEEIRHLIRSESMGIVDFEIPPGESSYSRSRSYTFEQDARILALLPHMHLRGKAARYEITFPDGRHEVLLDVPEYDFAWQHNYTFAEPVLAPAGTRIDLTLWWDNSADNPHNPDPTKTVRFGNPTTDEMGFGFITWTEVEPRDHVVGEPIPSDMRATWNVMATTQPPQRPTTRD